MRWLAMAILAFALCVGGTAGCEEYWSDASDGWMSEDNGGGGEGDTWPSIDSDLQIKTEDY